MFEVDANLLKYIRRKIIDWRKGNFYYFPWRDTSNPWHALVAEIMLQRTRAEQVVPVYIYFCEKFKTPPEYLNNNTCDVFQSLGLLWRNERLKELAEILSEKEIPSDRESLLKLPGIGDYIAAAYRSLYLDQRDVIIDSNIVRIYGRFFGLKTDNETRRIKWFRELANKITPQRKFKDFNYGLIDFTRVICKPKPQCSICILKYKCIYHLNE